MLNRRIIASGLSVSTLMALVLASMLALSPGPLQATDIAWHSKGEPAKWSWVGSERTYERTGTAEFKTGEKAAFVCNGMNHPLAENNKLPSDTQCVYRFDDLSAITTHSASTFDNVAQESKGAGKFVTGSGRFEGITGEFTQVARFKGDTVETDVVGSYSLPATSRGVQ